MKTSSLEPLGRFSQPTLIVLAVLIAGDNHGYGIMQELERQAGIRVGAGTLYGTLGKLEQDGFTRQVGSNGRRTVYAVTAKGRKAFSAQTRDLRRFGSALSKLAGA